MFLMNFLDKSVSLRLFLLSLLLVLLAPFPSDWRDRQDWEIARRAQQDHGYLVQGEALRDIFQRHPWRQDIYEPLGVGAFLRGDDVLAFEYLWAAYRQGFISSQGQEILVKELLRQSKKEDAVQILMQIELPANCQFLSKYADTKRDLSFQDWLAILEKWNEKCPEEPFVLYQWGLFRIVENYHEGINCIKKAAQIQPEYQRVVSLLEEVNALSLSNQNHAYRLTLLGRALINLREYEEARLALQKAVEIQPVYAEAWAFLGEAKLELSDTTGKDDLKRAISLNPRSVISRVLYSLYLSREGNLEQAIEEMQQVLKIEPEQSIWYLELGRLTAKSGNLFEAYSYYEQATSLDPDNSLVWKSLAQFCVTYDFDVSGKGLFSAREALKLSPLDADAHKVMGDVLFKQGDFASAERFWVRTLQLNPSHAEAFLALGQLYLQENRLGEAQKMLENVFLFASQEETKLIAARLLERYFQVPLLTKNEP